MINFFRYIFILVFSVSLSACTGLPKDVQPVKGFELSKYLGTWYEIARLDHSFERGLDDISAHYSLRDDGGVRVLNKGFSRENAEWKNAEGKAYFVGDDDTAHLKVSFFGPFYGSYVVFYLDESYQFAFISSYNKDYLWLLSRTPEVDQKTKDLFLQEAKNKGFNTDQLIWVNHTQNHVLFTN